jgi:serine/threonine-protein kinase
VSDADPFLAEAERRGLLTATQAEDCRRIAAALREVQVDLSIDEIAARKGFVTADQGAEIRRWLARLRVGRYEVIERLGEGAAGIVWKARDTKLDRVVALKVLSQKAQVAQAFRERFLREARIAVTLNDVNIVRGLDYGEADGYQYFAMEFVDGGNAETRLAQFGRIAEKEAVSMALDVVHALQYVQKFHIVHRDIKPSNLLLTPSGRVKLCDLGLAKPMLAETELLAGDGSTAGTPFYMSPEQIREPEKVDWRSDVYSLGATLYHLLTGVPVFRPDGQTSVIQKHLREKPRNPREHVLEISDGAASVVMRMLLKSPADRYASLDELRGDLEAVLEGRTPQHTAPALPPDEATAERHARLAIARRITEKNLPRERFPWAALAGFVILGALALAVATGVNFAKPWATPAKPPEDAAAAEPPKAPAATHAEAPKPVASAAPPAPVGPDPGQEQIAREQFTAREPGWHKQTEDGHFTSAIGELSNFMAKYPGTRAALSAQDEIRRIDGTVARGRFDALVQRSNDDVKHRRFDEAEAELNQAARIEIGWAEQQVKPLLAAVRTAKQNHDTERETQEPAFADLYGRVLLQAGEDMAAANAMADRDAKTVPAYDAEVSELREDLAALAKDGTDIDTIDKTTARGALALLLARLSRGEVDEAREAVDAVRATGGDTDAARKRIERVERVLKRQAAELLAGAEEDLAANHPDAAQRAAEDAQRRFPGYAPATVMLARVRLAMNDADQAIVLLANVTSRRDAPPESHYWLGVALARKREDFARAEAEFGRFLESAARDDPLRPAAEAARKSAHDLSVEADVKRWREIAKSLTGKGRRDAEEGAWGRVAELRGDDAEALLALGRIYLDKKQTTQAYVVLSRVAKLQATDAQKRKAAELLGQIKGSGFPTDDGRALADDGEKYFEHENWDRAIQNFQAALLVSPYLYSARVKLIRACLARAAEKGAAENARVAADAASLLVAQYPDESLPLALRSDARLAAGDVKGARDDAAKAADLDAKSSAAQLALGRARLAGGDATRAIEAFHAANTIEPSADALLGLAAAYLARLLPGDRAAAADMLANVKQLYGPPAALRAKYDELMKALEDAK